MNTILRSSVIAAVLLLSSLDAGWAESMSSPSQNPLIGSRVFGAKGCATCHSVNGVGGKVGPDLGKIPRPRSFYDLASAMWNHLPRMLDRMQQLGIPRPSLNAVEIGDLIGFLYTVRYFDLPGQPDVGRQLFADKRCIVCHQVRGTGGVIGPNLDFLMRFESPIFVAATMWNHGPQMAATMRARGVERPTFTAVELRDVLAFLAPAAAGPQEEPIYVLPGRADTGRRLFGEKHCIECHSVAGVGGRVGPDLVERDIRRSPLEFAAAMWNKAPSMMAAMTRLGLAVPQLRPDEMADIVGYLYSVRYFGGTGDPSNGVRLATAKGCLACHSLYGERGKMASDLSRAKGLESPAAVIAGLWNHVGIMPASQGGQGSAWPVFRPEEMTDLMAFLQSLKR